MTHQEKCWVGVDFDGTLAEYYGWEDPRNGKPVLPMVERVRQLRSRDVEVRIMTARVCSAAGPERIAEQTKVIQDWCQTVFGETFPVTAEKDFNMSLLLDDRAEGIEINTGRAARSRTIVRPEAIESAMALLSAKMAETLHRHGHGTYASRHELLGILEEEYHELVAAVTSGSLEEVLEEAADIAVAAVFGIACVEQGAMQW